MKKKHIAIFLLLLVSSLAFSQEPNVQFEIEAQAIGTDKDVVPFWMRSNQFGSVPTEGASGSIIGRAYKEYDDAHSSLFNWGGGFEGRVNGGKNSKLLLIEGYLKAKVGVFQLKVGRTKDIMGFNGDSLLTSGNFSISGNALGIPKAEISIPDYYSIPIFRGVLAFKGSFSHGWVGTTKIRDILGSDQLSGRPYPSFTDEAKTYLHQKSLYARLGKDSWKFRLYGGFNHQVYWGDEKRIFGNDFKLSSIKTLYYVTTGQAYGAYNIARSKIGNHIGSIDLAIEYPIRNVNVVLYRQNFYETGALAKLANIKDGLTGIAIENKNETKSTSFHWNKLLVELLYTKNQAGELDSKPTNSGDEDYYNNYIYEQGWSYKGAGLGSPFITSRKDMRDGLINDPADYFINNRVIALHLGATANVFQWNHLVKISYSKNYGTFATSTEGRSTGPDRFPPKFGIFQKVSQLSAYLEGNRNLANDLKIGFMIGIDQGKLLRNSTGFGIKAVKTL